MSANPPKSSRSVYSSVYVDTQSGWRMLFFSLTISCILGLGVQVYLSPQRVRGWVERAISRQSRPIGLRFEKAELRLSRGAIPQFAIVLKSVDVAPAPDCRPEPSLRIAELFVPFELTSFFRAKVRVGTVAAEDMVADLDGLKARCPQGSQPEPIAEPSSSPPSPRKAASADDEAPRAEPIRKTDGPTEAWWTPEQQVSIQNLVSGFEFKRVELQFEKKTKKVYFDSFEVETAPGRDDVRLSTRVRIPPELAFGETVPPLEIEGTVRATRADVTIVSKMSEGRLTAGAVLEPGSEGRLLIRSELVLEDVPLSALTPLFVKAGVFRDTFKPRFLWLDCRAKIAGQFQGLFRNSPLEIQGCSIEGDGTLVKLDSAVRRPTGAWDPFRIDIVNARMSRVLETFSLKGPDGVAEDFGRLSGALTVQSPSEARFTGAVEDVKLRFSSRKVRALQLVKRIGADATVKGDRVLATLSDLEVVGGDVDGKVELESTRGWPDGEVRISFDRLRMDPEVERTMTGGTLEGLSMRGGGQLKAGKLVGGKAEFRVKGLANQQYRFKEATIRADFRSDVRSDGRGDEGGGADFGVELTSPEIEIHREAPLFVASQAFFFGHEFDGEWIAVKDAAVSGSVLPAGGLAWRRAFGTLENGKILFTSSGSLSRDRELFGWVTVDYPSVRKLKWSMSGTTDSPVFKDDSKTLEELRKRIRIDDRALGLPERRRASHQIEEAD